MAGERWPTTQHLKPARRCSPGPKATTGGCSTSDICTSCSMWLAVEDRVESADDGGGIHASKFVTFEGGIHASKFVTFQ
uniref:Uncharacterized protein n=1 Tax=Oryza nivara TaxID=4536 RepID=A0A0E0HS60_ORYNI